MLIQQIFFAVASVEHVTRFLMKRLFCSTALKKEKGGSVWVWHVQHAAMSLMARFKATREAKEQECARRKSRFFLVEKTRGEVYDSEPSYVIANAGASQRAWLEYIEERVTADETAT